MHNNEYPEKCFTKKDVMVERKIADEFILVPIRQHVADLESIYVLNEVGGRIWELVDGKRPIKEIRDIIVKEFEVSSEQAEADLREFLEQLQNIGGIEAV